LRRISWLAMLAAAGVVLVGLQSVGPARAAEPTPTSSTNPIPTMAYYYIWFDSNSWDRAKMDYPLLGHYTSDDRAVMRQHIQWAKAAGINGFIVSWKSTTVLNRRLDQLAQVAEEENFKLVIIYEGLDFNRNPLPASRVAADLDVFIKQFAERKPFQVFSKPLLIWSGTWKFTPDEISSVTKARRNSLLILASEKNVDDYSKVAGLFDGDAYYWSSVNPDTNSNYQDKLSQMGDEVHKNGGIWIPPAAPGFNATLVGGTSNVDRKDGDTFLAQINTAMKSSPDILGIISWNEFSENTYIEPSQKYGSKYLDVLSEYEHQPLPSIPSFDSSEANGTYPDVLPASRVIAIGGIALLVLVGAVVIVRRHSIVAKEMKDR